MITASEIAKVSSSMVYRELALHDIKPSFIHNPIRLGYGTKQYMVDAVLKLAKWRHISLIDLSEEILAPMANILVREFYSRKTLTIYELELPPVQSQLDCASYAGIRVIGKTEDGPHDINVPGVDEPCYRIRIDILVDDV